MDWDYKKLKCALPEEIGALSALHSLYLHDGELSGSISPMIGALTSLTVLYLHRNPLSGAVPASLSNLTNLETLSLTDTNLSNAPTKYLDTKSEVQPYLLTLWHPQALRFLKYGIAITKRQLMVSTVTSTDPFFDFLATHGESLAELTPSFLDPLSCCNRDREALVICWILMGGSEERLRQGCEDDVARWNEVTVEGGRVVRVEWAREGFSGTIPAEIGELDALTVMDLWANEIGGVLPPEIGNLASLVDLLLNVNRIEGGVPSEVGNITSLSVLFLYNNSFSGSVPSSFGNLTNLSSLYLNNNNFAHHVPPAPIHSNKDQVQTYLSTLRTSPPP